MFVLTLKNIVAHRARFIGTAFAVLIGVAFMAGTMVFTDTLSATFGDVLDDANQGVDAMVRVPAESELSSPGGSLAQSGSTIDRSVVDVVRSLDGVEDAVVRVTGYAQLVGPGGEPVGDQSQTPAFGFNWTGVDSLSPFRLVEGHAPTNDDEIVIDKGSANKSGYQPGDVATVLTKAEPRQFVISGVATFGSADSPAGAGAVLFTQTVAEELLSSPGQVDGIVVSAVTGTSQEDVVASIEAASNGEVEVITGAQLLAEDKAEFDENFGPFKVVMLVFAAIAVFVGAFIINNTFSITVAQRSKEMAMLRALGASRRQVLRSILVEATVTGVFASAVGLAAGVGVAKGLAAMLGSFGIELPDGPAVISPSSMLIAFSVGVVVTVASALLPARRAGRILPIAAMRDVAQDRSGTSVTRTVVGILITGGAVALLLVGLSGAGIAAVGVGAVFSFIGVAVLGPVIARPVAAVLGVPLRLAGLPGELATRNAMRSPKRTARTASSLMIGVGLVACITVIGASVKTSFAGSIAENYHGSHVVESGVFDTGGGLSPQLADTLRNTDGIDTVSSLRFSPAIIDGSQTDFFDAFDAETIGTLFELGTVEGDLDLGFDGIAVDREKASENGWTLGSTVPVTFPTGEVDFTIRALFDTSEWFQDQFVDIAAFDKFLPGSLDARIYVDGDDEAVNAAAAAYPTADVLDQEEFFDSVSAEIDQVLGIVYAMLALAVIIALFGIANTLALSIFERTREIGLLRAVGMTRRQVRTTIRGESVIIALFGTTLGLGVGTFFGWAAVNALSSEGIDQLTIPVGQLLVITAIAAFAGVLTAVLPARRAARMNVLTALAAQ